MRDGSVVGLVFGRDGGTGKALNIDVVKLYVENNGVSWNTAPPDSVRPPAPSNISVTVEPSATSQKPVEKRANRVDEPEPKLKCSVDSRATQWNSFASVRLTVSRKYVGTFLVAPGGGSVFGFDCEEGGHNYEMRVKVEGVASEGSCSGDFTVASDRTRFAPQIVIYPNGRMFCQLVPF
jgi:hypothetical protein